MTDATLHLLARVEKILHERPPGALDSFRAYYRWHVDGAMAADPRWSRWPRRPVALGLFAVTSLVGYGTRVIRVWPMLWCIRGLLWLARMRSRLRLTKPDFALHRSLLQCWWAHQRAWWRDRPRLAAIRERALIRGLEFLAEREEQRARQMADVHALLLDRILPDWEHPC